MLLVKCCLAKLYSLQLEPDQTWQTWPENINLLQFLDGGSGLSIVDLTITSMMRDVRQHMTQVSNDIDNAHTSLKESMQNLQTAFLNYNSSTVIGNTFAR